MILLITVSVGLVVFGIKHFRVACLIKWVTNYNKNQANFQNQESVKATNVVIPEENDNREQKTSNHENVSITDLKIRVIQTSNYENVSITDLKIGVIQTSNYENVSITDLKIQNSNGHPHNKVESLSPDAEYENRDQIQTSNYETITVADIDTSVNLYEQIRL